MEISIEVKCPHCGKDVEYLQRSIWNGNDSVTVVLDPYPCSCRATALDLACAGCGASLGKVALHDSDDPALPVEVPVCETCLESRQNDQCSGCNGARYVRHDD